MIARSILFFLLGTQAAWGKPPAHVELVNARTNERLEVRADHLPSPSVINRFFRCAKDRRYTLMDPRLVQGVVVAANRLGARRVVILSAFRTSRYNEERRERGHRVALRSRHIHGQALDLRIPGVPTKRLCRYFREGWRGGVGCYEKPRFIHIDVGPVRTWDH